MVSEPVTTEYEPDPEPPERWQVPQPVLPPKEPVVCKIPELTEAKSVSCWAVGAHAELAPGVVVRRSTVHPWENCRDRISAVSRKKLVTPTATSSPT